MALVDDKEIKTVLDSRLRLAHLKGDEKEEIIKRLSENILTKINLAILEKMSEKERAELLRICDGQDDNKVLDFIESKVDNISGIVKEATDKVISDFKMMLYSR